MSDVLESQEKPKREEIRRPSPNLIRLWANDAQVGHTPWDFRLVFGQVRRGDPGVLEVEEQVEINMSPQFAKRLFEALQVNAEGYEERFGKIETPSGVPPVKKSE